MGSLKKYSAAWKQACDSLLLNIFSILKVIEMFDCASLVVCDQIFMNSKDPQGVCYVTLRPCVRLAPLVYVSISVMCVYRHVIVVIWYDLENFVLYFRFPLKI